MWRKGEFANTSNAGFMTDHQESPAQDKKAKGARRLQNVCPVTVAQIKNQTGDDFKLFGMSAQILVIVGILKEYEVQSTKATYQIEDHTGTISAIWWLENDANSGPNLPDVKEGRYCRVFGSFRVQEGEKMLMILRMFEVDHMNIITTHLLQVVQTRLEAESMKKHGGVKLQAKNPGAELANSMSFMDTDNNYMRQTGLTPIQEKVFRILQPVESSMGLSRTKILEHFPQNQHREVNNALEFLVNEGHTYSTIDNDHFKATDSL